MGFLRVRSRRSQWGHVSEWCVHEKKRNYHGSEKKKRNGSTCIDDWNEKKKYIYIEVSEKGKPQILEKKSLKWKGRKTHLLLKWTKKRAVLLLGKHGKTEKGNNYIDGINKKNKRKRMRPQTLLTEVREI